MTKLQLTLTDKEAAVLKSYGSQFGYSLSKTVRFLISKATEKAIVGGTIPEFPMSESTEASGIEALKEHRAGKTTKVDDVSDYFTKL
ncbi:hypothetical protein ACFL0F_01780 [Patescibacteria group bacterium]